MNEKKYQEPKSPSNDDINEAFEMNDVEALKDFVIGAALYWKVSSSIESLCSRLIDHQDEEVRGNAILGLGHVARRFGHLERRFEKVIENGLLDSSAYVRGQAWAAGDDVNHFLGWHIALK